MPDYKLWLYRFIIIALIAVTVLFLWQQYAARQMKEIQQVWQVEWREQESTLIDTLKASEQALTVDPVVELWLDRCGVEDRREYQTVLERLGIGLTKEELDLLAHDFLRCGTQAADQSFAQAIALNREIARLKQWYTVTEFIPEIDSAYYQDRLDRWEALGTAMYDLQQVQHELDALQRDLISARRDGLPVSGDRIQALLQDVQLTRQSLSEVTVSYRTLLRELSV